MQFLKILFWVLLAVFITLFASRNWFDVTLNLWGDLQADIKVPVLLALIFLIGWLPTMLIYRARLWALRRRVEPREVQPAESAAPAEQDDAPVI